MKEKNNNSGKEILQLLQENYEIKSAQDLSSALKDMFKGSNSSFLSLGVSNSNSPNSLFKFFLVLPFL